MAKKKQTSKPYKRSTPATQSSRDRTIQLVALAVLLVAAVAIAFAVLNNPDDQQAAAPTRGPARQYDAPPPMTIDPSKAYTATVTMAKGGTFTIQLFPDKAPQTVNSFVFLAREGFFDGVTFHRVLDGFMAQGGDPTGTGRGGPGYMIPNEDSDLTFNRAGLVAMANSGRDRNGSQFFITYAPVERLTGGYTIFGEVTSGMDVVNDLRRRDPDRAPNFEGDAIETITITEQ
jgi:cyclophilin family peptidyl-prolyl cis-trans isomerase